MIIGGVCMNDELLDTIYLMSPTHSSMTPLPHSTTFTDRFFYNQTFALSTRLPLAEFAPFAL